MKKECLPSHTIYYPKLTSRQVDEEMGLAGSISQYFYGFG